MAPGMTWWKCPVCGWRIVADTGKLGDAYRAHMQGWHWDGK